MPVQCPAAQRFDNFGRAQLTHVDDSKNCRRVYLLQVDATLFNVMVLRAWGRIGQKKVRVKEEWYESMGEALRQANRIYRQKIGRGYVEVVGAAVDHQAGGGGAGSSRER